MIHHRDVIDGQGLERVALVRRLPAHHQHRRVGRRLENGQVAEVDHGPQGDLLTQEPAQRLAIASAHELVGAYVHKHAVAVQLLEPLGVEVHVDVSYTVVNVGVDLLEVALEVLDLLLTHVGRVGDHHVEAVLLLVNLGEVHLPDEGGMLGVAQELPAQLFGAHTSRVALAMPL
ncbi:MAG: hypothetical protein MAG451_00597 [Anaerolineales bacterium]|nr:hypothetical protein [Anaerolineales bacterium]